MAGRHCLTFQFTLHHKHYLRLTPDAVSVRQSLSLSLSVSVPLSLCLSFSLSLSLSALPLSLSVSFFLLVCHSLCQNNIILVRYKYAAMSLVLVGLHTVSPFPIGHYLLGAHSPSLTLTFVSRLIAPSVPVS